MIPRVDLIVQRLSFIVHGLDSVDHLSELSRQALLFLRDLVEGGDLPLLALIYALLVLANCV